MPQQKGLKSLQGLRLASFNSHNPDDPSIGKMDMRAVDQQGQSLGSKEHTKLPKLSVSNKGDGDACLSKIALSLSSLIWKNPKDLYNGPLQPHCFFLPSSSLPLFTILNRNLLVASQDVVFKCWLLARP